ncbi:MAG: disulfide bond formation protein B [Acetobacteraceae bacterium]|nr:disulfide bond formation protein B [Acetobacteraceae bacterium]
MSGALLILLLTAGAPLFARGTEGWFNLVPCELCLWQRWPYWAAAVAALGALLLWRRGGRRLLWLAAAAAGVSAAIGAFHVGVEFGWWPSPLPGCRVAASGAARSVDDLMSSLGAAPAKPCDEPAYLIPGLPLSMAAMNLIYGSGVALLAALIARRPEKPA